MRPAEPIIQHCRTAPKRTPGNVCRPLAIAIDGPVASGKTAVGRLVARRLGLRFLDTGSMYRAVTRVALDTGVDLNDADALTALAARLDLRLSYAEGVDRLTADGADLTDGLTDPRRGARRLVGRPRTRREAFPRRAAAANGCRRAGRDGRPRHRHRRTAGRAGEGLPERFRQSTGEAGGAATWRPAGPRLTSGSVLEGADKA